MKHRIQQAAFSLMELILCISIIALLAGVAQPKFVSFLNRDRVVRSAERMAVDLRLAQSEAIKQQTDVTVAVNTTTGAYTLSPLSPDSKGQTSRSVSLASEPYYKCSISEADFGGTKSLIFSAYGVPAVGGTVMVASGRYQCTLTIDGVTGRITIGPIVGTTTFVLTN